MLLVRPQKRWHNLPPPPAQAHCHHQRLKIKKITEKVNVKSAEVKPLTDQLELSSLCVLGVVTCSEVVGHSHHGQCVSCIDSV